MGRRWKKRTWWSARCIRLQLRYPAFGQERWAWGGASISIGCSAKSLYRLAHLGVRTGQARTSWNWTCPLMAIWGEMVWEAIRWWWLILKEHYEVPSVMTWSVGAQHQLSDTSGMEQHSGMPNCIRNWSGTRHWKIIWCQTWGQILSILSDGTEDASIP